jgi:hypothetical protein
MSDTNTGPTTPPPTAPASNAGGATTREQQRRNNAELDAIDDGEKQPAETTKRKDKDKEIFKGKVEKMGGNVFQLADEGRKGNQFTLTLEALANYAAIELDRPKDLGVLFGTTCTTPTIAEPSDQPPMSSDGVNRVTRDHRLYIAWKFECESYNNRVVELATNLHKMFTVILLQCSQNVKTKLESTTGYATAKSSDNCQWLITTLKNICHRFEHTENRFVSLINAKAAIFQYRQGQNQSVTEYFETYKELIAVLESYEGRLHDPEEAAPDATLLTGLTVEERDTYMRDRYCAILFIRNADSHRFDGLKAELSNDFSKGRDEYPTNLTDAHKLLATYKCTLTTKRAPAAHAPRHTRSDGRGSGGGRGSSPGRGGGRTGKVLTQVAMSLAQLDHHFPEGIPQHFVLLDSDSTVSIFCNAALLSDIYHVDEPLYLATNGGHQIATQMGTLPNFGPVWYNPNSIANILSLAQVRAVRRVTMDTAKAPAFHVHKLDGSGTTIFYEHPSGLYLYDTSVSPTLDDTITGDPTNHSNTTVLAYSCLQTVADNQVNFTGRQIAAADEARRLYRLIGRPGYSRFIAALNENHS